MISGPERLRAWITRSKLTQRAAAKLLGLNDVHLSQILNRQRKPGLDNAVKIEQRTGISVESWVLTKVSTRRPKRTPVTVQPVEITE
jgi:transcriptional regulator with XRE-family HTH domain